ncbi:MAG: ribonuclease III [Deltaproteobacteria bacterium]|nr:ribonuclease III [Deltaproteobacteria bacterium]
MKGVLRIRQTWETIRRVENRLDNLTSKLGYTFRNKGLLEEAFRHSSYVNEVGDPDLRDNERLEFLGDAVLDLSISHLLMDRFKEAREGELSKFRAMVVDEQSLCQIAQGLNLGGCLLLGRGEERTQGRCKPSILANALEALMGALYLDAGFARTDEMVRRLFIPLIRELEEVSIRDYKSLLQEYTQLHHKVRPEYVLVDEKGPPHDRVFRIALRLNGRVVADSTGRSKKAAEQKAAREAYRWLTEKAPAP